MRAIDPRLECQFVEHVLLKPMVADDRKLLVVTDVGAASPQTKWWALTHINRHASSVTLRRRPHPGRQPMPPLTNRRVLGLPE